MLTLALDTTSEIGGVGIFRDAECLVLLPNRGAANQYSVRLFELVEQATTQAHVGLGEIDLFATANGPGSFTGIRVGLAAARAWGKAFARPVRGVSVLEAMVNSGRPATDWAFPVMDARRGEFFVGAFRRIAQPVEPGFSPALAGPGCGPKKTGSLSAPEISGSHGEPSRSALKGGSTAAHLARANYGPADDGWIFKPDDLRAFIERHAAGGETATCLVQAHDQSAAGLRAKLPSTLEWRQIEGVLLNDIAEIARREEESGLPQAVAKLEAYYIRRPDAEVKLGAGG